MRALVGSLVALSFALAAQPDSGQSPDAMMARMESAMAEAQAQAAQSDPVIVSAEKQSRLWLEGVQAFRDGRYAEAEHKLHLLELRVEGKARLDAILLGSYTNDFLLTIDQVEDGDAAIVYLRGAAQARQGKFAQAAEAMSEAIRIDPKFFDAKADLALISLLRHKPDVARQQLKYMGKLLKHCDQKCDEKQVRYDRVSALLDREAAS